MLKDIAVSAFENEMKIKHIKIDYDKLGCLVDDLLAQKDMKFKESENVDNLERFVQLSFIQNSVNYCFWFDHPFRKYVNHELSGSEALWDVFKRYEILLDAKYLSTILVQDIYFMFGDIPLIMERQKCLQDVGTILCKKYQGEAINLLEECSFDCNLIAETIAKEFATWDDSYENMKFYKRIQSFLNFLTRSSDLNRRLQHIEDGTLLADYQIPKVFVHYGITRYSNELSSKICNLELIQSHGREELDLRISTIILGEVIKNKLMKKGMILTSYELDAYLWRLGRSIDCLHHLCKSIWY